MSKPAIERFVEKIEVNPDTLCWQWQGSLAQKGYGSIYDGRTELAHRFSYIWFKGEIPVGLTVDHLCRNRGCVNPDHLELVTIGENVLRGVGLTSQNAQKTHCKRGHPLTPDNLYHDTRGRRCATCSRESTKNWDKGHRQEKIEYLRRYHLEHPRSKSTNTD